MSLILPAMDSGVCSKSTTKTLALGARLYASAFGALFAIAGLCAVLAGEYRLYVSQMPRAGGTRASVGLVAISVGFLASLLIELSALSALQSVIESRRRSALAGVLDGLRRLPAVIAPYIASRLRSFSCCSC